MNNRRNVKPGGFVLHLTQFLASDRYNVSREGKKTNSKRFFFDKEWFVFAQQKNNKKRASEE